MAGVRFQDLLIGHGISTHHACSSPVATPKNAIITVNIRQPVSHTTEVHQKESTTYKPLP